LGFFDIGKAFFVLLIDLRTRVAHISKLIIQSHLSPHTASTTLSLGLPAAVCRHTKKEDEIFRV
jgi:hypothetical protein